MAALDTMLLEDMCTRASSNKPGSSIIVNLKVRSLPLGSVKLFSVTLFLMFFCYFLVTGYYLENASPVVLVRH